jgi:hypothetical protein
LAEESIDMIDRAPAPKLVEFVLGIIEFGGSENRRSWSALVRRAYERLPPNAAKSIEFLLPVADVLEGKSRSILDGLPPEERALALEFLEDFEPETHEPVAAIAPEDRENG